MGIDIVAKFLINLIFVNIFPLFIYTSVRNQKLSVLVKNRDEEFIDYVDRLLYKAKQSGKNKVVWG
jgi:hypothetical protein